MKAPERLGPYEIGERIAEGGTSSVHAASRTEGSYRRSVAIKILRLDLAETEAAHRFRAERQILARLEHPNIARLYDGGTTPDGRPYLVMERIDGLPLDRYCDQRRATIEERLALFLKVCGAVQYAHRNLLIHRDLKPSNILVDGAGEPKLLDFGIAKQLHVEAGPPGALLTRFEVRPLTPSHASPEQVRGAAITTASDVYSLGVLLYGLLTGRSPYGTLAQAEPHEIERAICGRAPARPSAVVSAGLASEVVSGTDADASAGAPADLSSTESSRAEARHLSPHRLSWRLRGDLDTIVLKALAKEPERRYRSVAELSADLESHLASRPIGARPDTATYLAWKFARRHRAAVLFATTLAALLVAWVVDLEVQQRRLGREKAKAQQALAFLVEAFQKAGRPGQTAASLPATAVLDSAAGSIGRELAAQPDIQARLLASIGLAYWDQRRHQDASRSFERALVLRLARGERETETVAECWELVALTRHAAGHFDSALRAARQAVEIHRNGDPPNPVGLASSLNVLGDILAQQKATPEAEKLLAEAVAIAQKGGGEEMNRLVLYLTSLGRNQLNLGKDAAAERAYRRAFQMQNRADSTNELLSLYNEQKFATALGQLGRTVEAEARLRRIAARQRRLGAPESDRALTLGNLSNVLRAARKFDEAIAARRESLDILIRQLGPLHLRTSRAQEDLALLLFTVGRKDEGRPYAERALAANRRLAGERSMAVAGTLLTLAHFERGAERYDQGIELARQSLALFEAELGREHWQLVNPLREISGDLMDQKKFAEALPYLQRARDLTVRRDPRGSAERSMTDMLLAEALIEVGRGDEAEPLLHDSERRLRAEFGDGDARLPGIRTLLESAAKPANRPPPRATL